VQPGQIDPALRGLIDQTAQAQQQAALAQAAFFGSPILGAIGMLQRRQDLEQQQKDAESLAALLNQMNGDGGGQMPDNGGVTPSVANAGGQLPPSYAPISPLFTPQALPTVPGLGGGNGQGLGQGVPMQSPVAPQPIPQVPGASSGGFDLGRDLFQIPSAAPAPINAPAPTGMFTRQMAKQIVKEKLLPGIMNASLQGRMAQQKQDRIDANIKDTLRKTNSQIDGYEKQYPGIRPALEAAIDEKTGGFTTEAPKILEKRKSADESKDAYAKYDADVDLVRPNLLSGDPKVQSKALSDMRSSASLYLRNTGDLDGYKAILTSIENEQTGANQARSLALQAARDLQAAKNQDAAQSNAASRLKVEERTLALKEALQPLVAAKEKALINNLRAETKAKGRAEGTYDISYQTLKGPDGKLHRIAYSYDKSDPKREFSRVDLGEALPTGSQDSVGNFFKELNNDSGGTPPPAGKAAPPPAGKAPAQTPYIPYPTGTGHFILLPPPGAITPIPGNGKKPKGLVLPKGYTSGGK
jgi:hypothetical protein